jgi:fructose-1,6-bisphosphatase/inositol monophosphatase family enzyme
MIDEVGTLLRTVARDTVMPMFRALDPSEVHEKSPGELVTVADRAAEAAIAEGLRALLPGSVVVGEEAVADDPALVRRLGDDQPVWVVDPIDGTTNYASGRHPFAIMVALRRAGVTEAGWILDPATGSLLTGQAGRGVRLDGEPVRLTGPTPPAAAGLRGVASPSLPPGVRAAVRAGAARVGTVLPGHHCAAQEYRDILTGVQHYALFWRTMPWDHTAGVLLVQEAGGVARRLDGTAYDPADDRSGLLVAADEATWAAVDGALRDGAA